MNLKCLEDGQPIACNVELASDATDLSMVIVMDVAPAVAGVSDLQKAAAKALILKSAVEPDSPQLTARFTRISNCGAVHPLGENQLVSNRLQA